MVCERGSITRGSIRRENTGLEDTRGGEQEEQSSAGQVGQDRELD